MSDPQRDWIFKAIEDLLLDDLSSSEDAARLYLSEEGINPDEEIEKGRRVVKRIAFLMKANHQQEKDAGLLAKALELLRTKVAENAERTGQVLQQLLQARKPQVQFRNLSEWTDEQVRAVLDDVDVVELMEALEREEGKQ